jgi:hypothetical protein
MGAVLHPQGHRLCFNCWRKLAPADFDKPSPLHVPPGRCEECGEEDVPLFHLTAKNRRDLSRTEL